MSPEQAAGNSRHLTTAADVYGLGVILYELLSHRPPFQGESELEILQKVQEQDPPPPRRFNPAVDRDLETICLKCLHKDPELRYASAEAFARDLERWQAGETILARPSNTTERVWRWCRRKPLLAGLAGTVAVLMIAVAFVSTVAAVRLKAGRDKEVTLRREAEDKLWNSYLMQARANRHSGRLGQRFDSLEALAKAAAMRPSMELRNEAIACMTLPDLRLGRKLDIFFPTSTGTLDLPFERYAIGDEKGNLSLRRVSNDAEIDRLPGPGVWGHWIEFSPSGRYLAVNYHPVGRYFPNACHVWDLSKREVVLTVSNCWNGQVFSPDNRHCLFHRRDDGSALYDLQTLQEVRRLEVGELNHPYSSFSRDGRWLAIPSLADSDVRIVEVQTGRLQRKLPHPGSVRDLDWHPNNRWLATPCDDGKTYLWDATTGERLNEFGNHEHPCSYAQFNHRGNLLLITSWDSTLSMWDLARGSRHLVMSARNPLPRFSPDEKFAGTARIANQGVLLEASTAPECRPLRLLLGREEPTIRCGEIHADGRLLATGSADGVRFWDLATNEELGHIPMELVQSLSFLPDDSGLVTCGNDGVFLWPLESRSALSGSKDLGIGPPRRLAPGENWRELSLSMDGRHFAASEYSSAKDVSPMHNLVFEMDSTNSPVRIKGPVNQGISTLSPDARWLATGIWRDKEVTIWDARSGRKVTVLPVGDSAFYPKFSPDGRWLVAGTASEFYCWEVGTWKQHYVITPDATPTSQPSTTTFSPDGEIIAVFHRYNRTHFVDAHQGKVLATLDLDRHVPLCFSRDRGTLVMAAADGQLKVLDLRLIRRQLAEMNLDWDMPPLPPAEPLANADRIVLTIVTNGLSGVGTR